MKVIIPAAGKGTRMRPFTNTRAKPLLPVAGKPVIDHILDAILPLGPTAIFFVTGHMKHTFEEHVLKTYPDLTVRFCEQKEQRGTADAINAAKDAFDEDVLIVFSDTIFDTDLSVVKDTDADGIIWAVRVEDPSRFGVIVTDTDGMMTRIVEKPKEFVSDLANIGLYYVKDTRLLAEGIAHAYSVATKEVWLTDAFSYMVEHGARIKVLPVEGWYDTGTQEETLVTNTRLLKKHAPATPRIVGCTIIPPVAIDPSAIIVESTIGPHVTISEGVRITKSKVSDSIIDQQSVVGECDLTHSIIGQHVEARDVSGSVFLGDHSSVKKH